DVLLPELRRLRVLLQVVVAVRQPEPSLEGGRDDLRRVLPVLFRAEREYDADPLRLQPPDFGPQSGGVLNRFDAGELRLDRLEIVRLDRRLVHARGVEVAELALLR